MIFTLVRIQSLGKPGKDCYHFQMACGWEEKVGWLFSRFHMLLIFIVIYQHTSCQLRFSGQQTLVCPWDCTRPKEKKCCRGAVWLIAILVVPTQGFSAKWHLRGKFSVSYALDSMYMQKRCMHNWCRLMTASQTLCAGSAVVAGFTVIAITANSAKAKAPFSHCLGLNEIWQ